MFEVVIKTKDFLREFCVRELKSFTENSIEVISDDFLSVSFDNVQVLKKFAEDLIFFSRTVEGVFLRICEFESLDDEEIVLEKEIFSFISKELSFEIDAMKGENFSSREVERYFGEQVGRLSDKLFVDLSNPDLSFKVFCVKRGDNGNGDVSGSVNVVGLDLAGFMLNKREYKINVNSMSINSLLANYGLYLLGVDSEKDTYSIVDTTAHLGDCIIESSLFWPRKALNVKRRLSFPLSKILGGFAKLPMVQEDKNRYVGIVQNNKVFKEIKENINYTSVKVRVSQFELDWLDVKFKEEEFDYLLTQFPLFDDEVEREEFEKEFFYQAEFIAKKKICVICKSEVSKIFKKYKLKLKVEKKIFVGEQKYFVYVFGK